MVLMFLCSSKALAMSSIVYSPSPITAMSTFFASFRNSVGTTVVCGPPTTVRVVGFVSLAMLATLIVLSVWHVNGFAMPMMSGFRCCISSLIFS